LRNFGQIRKLARRKSELWFRSSNFEPEMVNSEFFRAYSSVGYPEYSGLTHNQGSQKKKT